MQGSGISTPEGTFKQRGNGSWIKFSSLSAAMERQSGAIRESVIVTVVPGRINRKGDYSRKGGTTARMARAIGAEVIILGPGSFHLLKLLESALFPRKFHSS